MHDPCAHLPLQAAAGPVASQEGRVREWGCEHRRRPCSELEHPATNKFVGLQ